MIGTPFYNPYRVCRLRKLQFYKYIYIYINLDQEYFDKISKKKGSLIIW